MIRIGLNSSRLLSPMHLRTTTTPLSATRLGVSIFSKSSSLHQSLLFSTSRFTFNSSSTTNATKSDSSSTPFLTWNDFLAKRIQRRRFNLGASILTGLLGMSAGWALLATIEIDPTQPIFGFDPLMVLFSSLILCGGASGLVLGPSLGSLVFRMSLGKNFPAFAQKNAEFLRHVQKNRPDPSKQTYANPVPDYYGEKIGSLKEYRRWLRDGIAYRKKVETFL